ncbi:2Fe-2S iron-sulfur cluster-binding protein [Mucilaginibacter sp. RCC_168]|uniref:2Fe-2S iron-sulfur cluster-binding protein n=1 Tax=Mucilaginibacter sp. RCC_168 TaxID=3239221 RepID=UPI003525482E
MKSYRMYKVIGKVKESSLVVSLYLAPIDGIPLTSFLPGQHLLFKLHIPGHEVPVFRYYSFSDMFNHEYYRVSVKKELPPGKNFDLPEGVASSYLYDCVKEGDILEAKGPSGDFYLNPEDNKPVVLIAGGIGITPLLSIIKSIAKSNPDKMVYLFYGVNESSEHAFQTELRQISDAHNNSCITTFYNKENSGDVQGLHYDYGGFINVQTILQITKEIYLDYYICGPGAMMTYITGELEKLGIDKQNIHTESFNHKNEENLAGEMPVPLSGQESLKLNADFSVEFLQSGKKILWDNRYRSILEFAEGNDIEISSGCLFGDCGTCLTEIREGNVRYTHQTLVAVDKGNCLPCSCIPTSDVILNA